MNNIKKPKKYKYSKSLRKQLLKLQSRPQYTNYYRFLKSKYWSIIKAIVLKRDRGQCTVCGSKYRLEIHHTTYKHLYSEHDHLEDLLTLCHKCHYEYHLIYEVK